MKAIHAEELSRLGDEIKEIENDIMSSEEGQYPHDPDPWWEGYIEKSTTLGLKIAEMNDRIGNRRLPRAFRWGRLMVAGSSPIIVGILALYLSFSTLTGSLSTLMERL